MEDVDVCAVVQAVAVILAGREHWADEVIDMAVLDIAAVQLVGKDWATGYSRALVERMRCCAVAVIVIAHMSMVCGD
jgi:hypothetical protein